MRAFIPWRSCRKGCLPVVNGLPVRYPFLTLHPSTLLPTTFRDQSVCFHGSTLSTRPEEQDIWVGKEIKTRVEELHSAGVDLYPRLPAGNWSSMSRFDRQFKTLQDGDTRTDVPVTSYQGRVESIRTAGNSLFFLNIVRKNVKLQLVVNHAQLFDSGVTKEVFKATRKLIQRGDIVAVTGVPCRTDSGQLSLRATELPRLLSPCLHQFPLRKHPDDSKLENLPRFVEKHVDMLVHQNTVQVMLLRSNIIRHMRDFMNLRGFTEVQTPILSSSAGGATAKAFETSASEFADKRLSLRIAPELWLKRLILGGMDRVYEIGASFRNEGIDKLHNPEFTTCEFYAAYTSRAKLLKLTENMLSSVVKRMGDVSVARDEEHQGLSKSRLPAPALPATFFEGPYKRIDFLPALSQALGERLPDLSSDSATDELVRIFEQNDLTLPPAPTLPWLLDRLCATYLEPQCEEPTWIINHPECLSPLSKSFLHSSVEGPQSVAARAELFVHGQEIVNCYEEENSPFEQRRKFMMQKKYAVGADGQTPKSEAMEVDEDYLKALEWGLPPTAGWGCGIDRLVMLLTAQQRINDVLPFGNLRSIVRTPEVRKMCRVKAAPVSLLQQNGRAEASSDVEREVKQRPRHGEQIILGQTGRTDTKIDPAEQAVIEISRKLSKEKKARAGRRNGNRGHSTAEQKRLAIWLAGRGAPDAAERFLEQ